MTSRWHIVVLCPMLSYGLGLIGMDIPKKNPEQRNLLSCSAEARKTQPMEISLSRSMELRKAEKTAQGNMYFPHCGGNTPPEYWFSGQDKNHSNKPVDCFFP